jgi:hypothetical protein
MKAVFLLLGFLFMLFNEMEDECIRGQWSGKFQKWNSINSWKKKWATTKNGLLKVYKPKWYHFGIRLPQEERFPFSATFLVFLTDAEHLFQMCKIVVASVAVGILTPTLGVAFFVGHLLVGIAKETFLKSWIKG